MLESKDIFRVFNKEEQVYYEFKPNASLKLDIVYSGNIKPDCFGVSLMAKTDGLTAVSSDYEASVSVNTEWLAMAIGGLPNKRIQDFDGLKIDESGIVDESREDVIISGQLSDSLYLSESEQCFYHYVDQSLDTARTVLELEYKSGYSFRLRLRSDIDLYKFEVDTRLDFAGIVAVIWHDAPKDADEAIQRYIDQTIDVSDFVRSEKLNSKGNRNIRFVPPVNP